MLLVPYGHVQQQVQKPNGRYWETYGCVGAATNGKVDLVAWEHAHMRTGSIPLPGVDHVEAMIVDRCDPRSTGTVEVSSGDLLPVQPTTRPLAVAGGQEAFLVAWECMTRGGTGVSTRLGVSILDRAGRLASSAAID